MQIEVKAQQVATVYLACKPRVVGGSSSHFPFAAGLRVTLLDTERAASEPLGQVTACVRATVVRSAVEVRIPEVPSAAGAAAAGQSEATRPSDIIDLGLLRRSDKPCSSWFLLRNLTQTLPLRLSLGPSAGVEIAGRVLHCTLKPRGEAGDTVRIAFTTVRCGVTLASAHSASMRLRSRVPWSGAGADGCMLCVLRLTTRPRAAQRPRRPGLHQEYIDVVNEDTQRCARTPSHHATV